MVEFFLSGDDKQNAAKMVDQGVVKFIPDPPGVEDKRSANKKRKKQMKQLQILMQQHQEDQMQQHLESKVQEYWKHFATWPDAWPETLNTRRSQAEFVAQFRAISTSKPDAGGVTKADSLVSRSFKTFVCVAPGQVGIRIAPVMNNSLSNMTNATVNPGQLVITDNVVVVDGQRFLKL